MENDKVQQQPERQHNRQDVWTSAFDSKGGASLPPPPFSAQATQFQVDESTHGGGHANPTPKGGGEIVSPTMAQRDADAIHDNIFNLFANGADIAPILAGKSVAHLRAVRQLYQARNGVALEQHLEMTLKAANYRAAMVYLMPALTLMERLQTQKNLLDDNEEAMVWLIQHATPAERAQARQQGIRQFILDELDWLQAYEMHKLIYPPAQFRPEHFSMAMKVISAADGTFWDDDDYVYMVIMDLDPVQRKSLWHNYHHKLEFVSANPAQLRKLCLGTEAQVIETAMDLATDGSGTYDNLAKKTVDQAAEKLKRQAELEAQQKAGDASVAEELAQIGNIKELVKPQYEEGGINENSLLGDLEGDLSEGEYLEYSQKLGVTDYDTAKRMILNAVGTFDDDEKAMKNAFEMIQDEGLRRKLWVDADVQAAFRAALNDEEKLTLAAYREGDSFKIAEDKFLEIVDRWMYGSGTYVELIQLLMSISDVDRKALVAQYPDKLRKFTIETTGYPELAKAVQEVATTGNASIDRILTAASMGAGTSEELITTKLDHLSEEDYLTLRMGYALVNGFQIPASIVPISYQEAARHRYEQLIADLSAEMGFDELQTTTDLFLKAPSLTEMRMPDGLEMSMFILQQRIRDKIATRDGGLGDRFIDLFSNSGGVADVAALQGLGLYHQALQDGNVGDLDLAAMAASYGQFDQAYGEHVAACDSVADVASTVAAIAVAVVVTIVTCGLGGPEAAVGLSAYLGGSSAATVVGAAAGAGAAKVAVNEAVGGEHFDVGDEGARAFALGAVDGALTAVTAGIAKSLQQSFYAALKLAGKELAAELSVGVIRSTEMSMSYLGRQAGIGAVRGAIDGVISGAIGNVVLTAADEATWRKGIWDTLSTFGVSLLQGAVMGGVAGGMMGGAAGAFGAGAANRAVGRLDEFAAKTGVDAQAFDHLGLANAEQLKTAFGKLSPDQAQILSKTLATFDAEQTTQLWNTLREQGLEGEIFRVMDDFFHKSNWVTDVEVEVLAVWQRFNYANANGEALQGYLEVVRIGDRVGIRAIVPYDGYGGNVILDPNRTTTVLGRAVEAARHPDGFAGAMDLPYGTNYFRFQGNFVVGKQMGGGNVLDIADWDWAKNNAWLQASIKRGDNIRFISDPTDLSNLFKNGDIDGNLTVTGQELGVLMNFGLAPHPKTGIVMPVSEIGIENIPKQWKRVQLKVKTNGDLGTMDEEAYNRFLNQSENAAREPKVVKNPDGEIEVTQENFFGGAPNTARKL